MSKNDVIVIGAGVAGLTASALLAHENLPVTLLESHSQVGGCAGTFRRGPYIFDVGATQVAGLEPGGSHERLFRHLQLKLPLAEPLDLACAVDLADGTPPVHLWRDSKRWQHERQFHFPGSSRFWKLCTWIHSNNWDFAGRDPVLPPRSLWDLRQFLQALRPGSLSSSVLTLFTIADLLKICGCNNDKRLRQFLDLYLRLYSQESADRTAALYGATVLQVAQEPHGLWHLQGSMQSLSNQLLSVLERDGGRLLLRHRAVALKPPQVPGEAWEVTVENRQGEKLLLRAADVVCTLPPQVLPNLIQEKQCLPKSYCRRLQKLPKPSGALVLYGAVSRLSLPVDCPAHMQWCAKDSSSLSLFVSVSRDGDGRAPGGEATLIASAFTPAEDWCYLPENTYQQRKLHTLHSMQAVLNARLNLSLADWHHVELATPRGFAYWTGRPNGIVGGLGQHPLHFGPFGLASRTPLSGLWLCGDSIHPGEGTAGVSQSALMVCRQLLATRGQELEIPS
ncbi:C-3',4' desaturase CrtD [cyanobiont of Ornithocercus magnificus]|nr:C-3',4' desaturase CrtD [cyanobiont of Ornithocercus magnificus]